MTNVFRRPQSAAALRALATACLLFSFAFVTDARNHGMIHAVGGANHEAQVILLPLTPENCNFRSSGEHAVTEASAVKRKLPYLVQQHI